MGLAALRHVEIFLDQGLDLCALYWQADSLPLSYQGSPQIGIFNVKSIGLKAYFPQQWLGDKGENIIFPGENHSKKKKKKKGFSLVNIWS